MALADFYPEGTTALASDGEQRSLVKLVALGGGGGGGGSGTLHGNGSPQGTVTGTQGQIYVDDLTQQIWVNTSGGTVWA